MTEQEISDAAKKLVQEGATMKELKGITNAELEAVYSVGFNFYRTGRFDDADKIFRFLVMFDHLSAKYWFALGAVQQAKKDFVHAVTSYAYCSFLDLSNPKPQLHAAECFMAMGDTENALGSLEALEQYCPKTTDLGREYLAKAAALKEKLAPAEGEKAE